MKEIFDKMDEIAQLLKQQSLQQKELLSFEEGCVYLGFKPSYMYKMTSSNEIPYYTPTGRKIIFKKSELTEWALRNRNASKEELVLTSFNLIKPQKNL